MKHLVTVSLMAYFILQRSVLIKFYIYRYNKGKILICHNAFRLD